MSNLQHQLRRQLLTAIIESVIVGDTDAIDFVNKKKYKFSLEALFRAMAVSYIDLPSLFPTTGIIRKTHQGYGYLDLGPMGENYLRASLALMSQFNVAYRVDANIKGARIVRPPSNVGAHVTLHNVTSGDIEKELSFTLDRIVHFRDGRDGKKASGFNPHIYPIRWFVFNVRGIPHQYIGNDQPHISIAMLAYVK